MEHRVLKAQNPCVHCGAKRIQFEFPTFCYMNGKTKLAYSPIPTEFLQLFTKQDILEEFFRYNIRAYNSNFSFTSLGVKVDKELANMTYGVYTFCTHRTFYHNIVQLILREGESKYLQFYFYDGQNVLSERERERERERELSTRMLIGKSLVTLNPSVELDQRVYVKATTSEVSDHTKTIQTHYGCYDPLSYPLSFPNGDSGWHPKISIQEVSIDEIITKNENNDDDFEENQTKIRVDLYQGIVDCFNVSEGQTSMVGERVVLPSSFIGGPRDMRKQFLDAMTLVQEDGSHDIFVTRTCNPN
uniref:Helitron helicase-like domain-containing protein n=1 Tax=Lactuca sativa TaxID=4236 RepID=A0A9R1VAH6_LACSA|nr:hypothetical protein LSAT_V11C600309920 [Lactuca sativa]